MNKLICLFSVVSVFFGFPAIAEENQRMTEFPDATVWDQSQRIEDPFFEAYRSSGGEVSVRSEEYFWSKGKEVYGRSDISSCIPDTNTCSVWKQAFRIVPRMEVDWAKLSSENSYGPAVHRSWAAPGVYMLEYTWVGLQDLVLKAYAARAGQLKAEDCSNPEEPGVNRCIRLTTAGTSPVDRLGKRSKFVDYRPAQEWLTRKLAYGRGYVPLQSVQQWERIIIDYAAARAGLLEGGPVANLRARWRGWLLVHQIVQ